MRESSIEQYAVAMFKAQGDLPYKFTSPGRRNVPDRLRLRAIPPEHQVIVAQYVQFVEFKATGEKPTAAQEREHARLRKLGFRVEVVDSMAGVNALSAAPASPVSTVEQGDAQSERSATHGMTLGERIAHVGGRTNAQGYIEFGSPMAVDALIEQVLRDIDCTRQDDDGAYQARYRVPGGQWSSWGHVVCGVKGHEQELRYIPDGHRPAPAAGDARDGERYRWLTEDHADPVVRKHRNDILRRMSVMSYSAASADIDAAIAAQRQGDA